MATIINNPGSGNGEGASSFIGLIVLVIVIVIAGWLFVAYALPLMRGGTASQNPTLNVNVKLPAGEPAAQPAPTPAQ